MVTVPPVDTEPFSISMTTASGAGTMTMQDGGGRSGGRGSVLDECVIGLQVMWLYDVTTSYWMRGKEGHENSC